MKQATQVKNNVLLSQALNYLGDSYFYRGDYCTAHQQYDRALQVATKARSRELQTVSQFNLAKLDVVQNREASAIPVLKKLIEESETVGMRALSVQASVYLAQALVGMNRPVEAQKVRDRALDRAEKLDLLIEQVRAHYFLGEVLQKAGRPPTVYAAQYREAMRILEAISKEVGNTRVLARADLRDLYHNAVHWSQ